MKIIAEEKGVIYRILFENGKSYIGQTTRKVRQRGLEHLREESGCVKLKNAFKKYGHEGCVMRVLRDNIPDQYLDFYENYYIDLYNSIEDGYNIKYNVDPLVDPEFDFGITYEPVPPKENPFARFANKNYVPPPKKIDVLLPKKRKEKKKVDDRINLSKKY
jgi:hypothetical protein